MITITVHHHHQPHGVCASQPIASAGSPGGQENEPAASLCTKGGSSVQVQYLASRRHFREASGKLNVGPQRSQASASEGKTSSNSIGFHARSVESLKQATNLTTQTEAAASNRDTSSIIHKNKLHSRSISLIINPEFSSDSSAESSSAGGLESTNAHLYRRRSVSRMPRRARLLPVDKQPVLPCEQVAREVNPPTSGGQPVDRRLSEGQAEMVSLGNQPLNPQTAMRQTNSGCLASLTAPREELATATSPSEKLSSSSLEQFRQAGIFLREISDEFFR